MSYIFEIDGETVWSPALTVGQIYGGFVKTLSQALDQPSGFTWNASDHVIIDAEVFVDFVLRLLSKSDGHPILAEQTRAVLGPSVVMLERAGTTLHSTTRKEARALEEALAIASSMPA